MDFLNAKEVYFNKKAHTHVFYNKVLIWSKVKSEFAKDFNVLTDFEEWGGIYDDYSSNLVSLKYANIWGLTNVIEVQTNEFKIEAKQDCKGAFGVVTTSVSTLKANIKYIFSVDIKTTEISRMPYNYIISSSGNQGIGAIELIKDGIWHRYSVIFTPSADKANGGILIAGDLRADTGRVFYIKNFHLEEYRVDNAGGRLII